MPNYRMIVFYEMCGTVEVEADTLKEAYDKVKDGPLPSDAYYVDGSFEIDHDMLEFDYPDEFKDFGI